MRFRVFSELVAQKAKPPFTSPSRGLSFPQVAVIPAIAGIQFKYEQKPLVLLPLRRRGEVFYGSPGVHAGSLGRAAGAHRSVFSLYLHEKSCLVTPSAFFCSRRGRRGYLLFGVVLSFDWIPAFAGMTPESPLFLLVLPPDPTQAQKMWVMTSPQGERGRVPSCIRHWMGTTGSFDSK